MDGYAARKSAPTTTRPGGDRRREDPPLRDREHDEPERERGESGARVRVQERDVEQHARAGPTTSGTGGSRRRSARRRARTRSRAARGTSRRAAGSGSPRRRCCRPSSPEARRAPRSRARAARGTSPGTPESRHAWSETNARSTQPDDARRRPPRATTSAPTPAAFLPGDARPAGRARTPATGKQVMAEREQLAARRRLAAEHVLWDQPVDDDHGRVARREHVRGGDCRQPAHVPRDDEQRDEEQRLLPRGRDVEASFRGRRAPTAAPWRRCGARAPRRGRRARPDQAAGANRRSPPASGRG